MLTLKIGLLKGFMVDQIVNKKETNLDDLSLFVPPWYPSHRANNLKR
jgi:hypothetical protein